MAERSGVARRLTFLPENAKVFLRRRLVELGGIGVFALAAGLGLMLATYSPSDPSMNYATTAPAANALGRFGAYASDLLLQTLGVGAPVLAVLLAGWAWAIVSHRGVRWFQVALLPVALILTASAMASFGGPDGTRLPAGLGGVVGRLVSHGALLPMLQMQNLPVGAGLLGLVLLPLAFFVGCLSLGIGPGTLAAGTARLLRSAAALGNLRLRRAPASDEAEEEADAPPPKPKREPLLKLRRAPEPVADDAEDEDATEDPVPARRVAAKPRVEKQPKTKANPQGRLDLAVAGEHQLPPMTLLAQPSVSRLEQVNEEALEQNARMLESTLEDFGVNGEIVKVRPGPVVTLYELEPAPGTKSSRVIGLSDDIARSMSAVSARIAVVQGRNAMGIELPNAKRETVFLRELLAAAEYDKTQAALPLALGKDIGGGPVIVDLARMPHLLVAGTTGSGKSVAINTMILSLLYRLSPDQCRLIMVDPKMLELSVYDGIPHLLAPVVTEPGKAVVALKWTVREMEDRYRKMSELGVRNIAGYNQRLAEARAKGEKLARTVQTGFDSEGKPTFEERPLSLEPLPFIVVIVDELADLMLVAGKDIEASVQRLAQMARAAGLHLIMATQRPSVDVITGTIKANFPTRISFQVTSKIDSRTILGEQGAEQLLGQGDMLYMPGAGRIQRVHGPFVSDTEVEQVVAFLKAQGEPVYVEAVTADIEGGAGGTGAGGGDGEGEYDEFYDRAVALVTRERKCSTSFIQRHFQIGYNRAARIVERMEVEGVVGRANHVGKREVLARDIDDRES